MPASATNAAAPTAVPADSAARIRSIAFDGRDQPVIDPLDIVPALIAEGHGAQFEVTIRATRVLTWVKQVFRRLRKYGWLAAGKHARWRPTAALAACQDAQALTGKAPNDLHQVPELRAPAAAPEPEPVPEVVATVPEPEEETPSRPAPRSTRKPRKGEGELSMSTRDLIETFEAERASIKQEVERLHARDAFLEKVLAELSAATPAKAPKAAKKTKRPSRSKNTAAPGATPKKERAKPVKAAVSASEAILTLLAGATKGLPAAEIAQYVTTTYGHKANSVRTTLYNLKKKGAITQDEERVYHHTKNVG